MIGKKCPWQKWKHVVKLDPDRTIDDTDLRELGTVGTDAVLIGGTQGITFEKTDRLLHRLRVQAPKLEVWQEISEQMAVVSDVDGYGIPVILNTQNTDWIIGRHTDAIQMFGRLIPWELVMTEGYIVLNQSAAVARLTDSVQILDAQKAAAFAIAGERILGLQTIYLEYSGMYGDPQVVREVRDSIQGHLIYGGGIDSAERAAEMAAIADTIVIGNAIYTKGMEVVKDTVAAVREISL